MRFAAVGAALLLSFPSRGAASGDESVEGAGMTVALSGNMITLGRTSEGGGDASALTLKVVGLAERDAYYQAIGSNAIEEHSLSAEDILGLDFATSGPKDVYYQGISASSTNLTAVLFDTEDGETTLSIQTLLFLQAGNITAGGETTEVAKGTLKLSFNVTNWPFCASTDQTGNPEQADSIAYCVDRDGDLEVGSFLDLSFEVTGPAQRQSNPVAPEKGGYSEKRHEKRQDEADATEESGSRRRRLPADDDDAGDDSIPDDDGTGGDDLGDYGATQDDYDDDYSYDDDDAKTVDTDHTPKPTHKPDESKKEPELPPGYSMSLPNDTTQALLDVSGWYWCSQHNAWYRVEGGIDYRVASDNSTAIFTARMHAASGTLLYDPTMTIAAQSSVTSTLVDSTSAAFALAASCHWASAFMALLATVVVAAGGQILA